MATETKYVWYKVQKSGRTNKYPVKAENFEKLVDEGRKRLGLEDEKIEIMLEDGTIIDGEYFQTLNPNTLLIFESKHSEDTVKALVERLEYIISHQPDMLTDISKEDPKLAKLIQHFNKEKDGNMKEDREDDEEWFKDVSKTYKTKSQYMRYKAKSRIRTYFYETRRKLLPKDSDDPEMIERKNEVIANFKSKLEANNFYEKLFDRTAEGKQKLCNKDGEFDCQGAYNEDSCPHHHINPYFSKEYLKEFTSWKFNYQIQKGREVWPQLEKAVEDPAREVNWVYFYKLLFTKENLKLVHTVCHKIEDHKLKVDEEQVFLPV